MTRFAIAQTIATNDIETNIARAETLIAQAGAGGARLLVFPEIHLTPFFPKHKGRDASAWAMREDGAEIARLAAAAKAADIVVVSNLYIENSAGERHDSSPVIDADGTVLGLSRMNEISQFDGFWEQDYYAPGDGWPVYDTAAGRIGVVICYDRHFPESYRACAKAGAELIVTPTCIEADEPLDLFEAEMRTLAYQNCVYAALANRCGPEETRRYAGASLITGPDGAVLAKAGGGEQLLYAEMDLGARRARAEALGWLSSRTARGGERALSRSIR
ncbi:carbon-nitrogen hydrolase family protein [Maricaulaceae bacterium MS644]